MRLSLYELPYSGDGLISGGESVRLARCNSHQSYIYRIAAMFGIAHTFGTPFGPMRAFLGLLLAVPLFANDPTSLAKEADVLMRNGSYAEALKFYDEAFVLDSNRRGLRYNAAIAAAMSGQIDRAFDCLDQAFPAQADWSLSFERVSQDRRLQPLREAERWSEFYAELQRRKVEYEKRTRPLTIWLSWRCDRSTSSYRTRLSGGIPHRGRPNLRIGNRIGDVPE